MKLGYARVSTVEQDLEVQRQRLHQLGAERIFEDHGLTGKNRARPGLEDALAACREGDELIVTKLDRLARSYTDANAITNELAERGVALNIGGLVHDPTDPMGKIFFGMFALFAEFEADMIAARTREGMAIAKAAGRMKGKQPKLSKAKRKLLVELVDAGTHTKAQIAEIFDIDRGTVYRTYDREVATRPSTAVPPSGTESESA